MNDCMYLGIAYDAMRILGYTYDKFYIDIKPKAGYKTENNCIMGHALTTRGQLVDKCSSPEYYTKLDKVRLELYQPKYFDNNPIVLLESQDITVAHSGDITSMIYQKLGAVGFITDGIVRDLDLIDKMSFPTFCQGANPIDAIDYWALTEFQTEITLQGVNIKPGDLIIASMDGVIRVPQEITDKFNAEVKKFAEKENKTRTLIQLADKENLKSILEKSYDQDGRW